jgi:COMPASS component SPP1
MKQELEIIEWRDSLIKLASQRSEEVGECGWDQRLCMDDEEWTEVGPTILENYDGQEQQEDESESFGEWWCRGKKNVTGTLGMASFLPHLPASFTTDLSVPF